MVSTHFEFCYTSSPDLRDVFNAILYTNIKQYCIYNGGDERKAIMELWTYKMDGLVQDCCIPIANALEILQSYTGSSKETSYQAQRDKLPYIRAEKVD